MAELPPATVRSGLNLSPTWKLDGTEDEVVPVTDGSSPGPETRDTLAIEREVPTSACGSRDLLKDTAVDPAASDTDESLTPEVLAILQGQRAAAGGSGSTETLQVKRASGSDRPPGQKPALAPALLAPPSRGEPLGAGEGTPFGPYRLLDRVGEGGMGVVFLAHDERLNRKVAIKLMRGGALASKIRRRRFLREAEAAAGLRHENMVSIHEIGERAGYPYFTMDHVEGVDLATHVVRHARSQEVIARLLRVVADAVNHFHRHGIIHRDLKPDNVLVDRDGTPKIIDFGIAKRTCSAEQNTVCTLEGDVLGTPYFMPPEQAAGNVLEVDTRSDVYALGAILYHLIGGAPPYAGLPPTRVLIAIQNGDPTSLRKLRPDVDVDLLAIVEKAMARDPQRRYQTAAELAADLQRYLDNEPIQARPAPIWHRARKLARRRPALLVAGLVTLLALAVAVGVSTWRARREQARINELLELARRMPLEQRPHHLAQILGLDPDNHLAKLHHELAVLKLDARRAGREEARLAEERRQREVAQEQLLQEQEQRRRERAEARVRGAQAREQAQRDAETQVRLAARQRAEALLTQARSIRDGLASVRLLDEAFGLLAPREDREARDAGVLVAAFLDGGAVSAHEAGVGRAAEFALWQQVAGAKLKVALHLARAAVAENQDGLARYWLEEAREAALGQPTPELVRAEQAVRELENGQHALERGLELSRRGEWLAAREALLGLERLLPARDELERALATVRDKCQEDGRRLLAEALALLDSAPDRALLTARRAERFLGDDADPARALIDRSAGRISLRARQETASLFLGSQVEQLRALAQLLEAARVLEGTGAHEALLDEFHARNRLLMDPRLKGLVYVSSVREAGSSGFYMLTTEVSNRDYAAFVAAGGYGDPSLFDREARGLLESFRDESGHAGPRTWRRGSYGDQGNAKRPVTGVSWYEARAYARWLGQTSGLRWRLPTRTEWEIAAGWTPQLQRFRRYPWGDDYAGQLRAGRVPALVGSCDADLSPVGLRDMGGNVSEWVDCAAHGEGASVSPGLKGASVASGARTAAHLARVTFTGTPGPVPPAELAPWVGFRLVLDPTGGE